MGTMISSLDEIERLRFEPFPTSPRNVGKVVRSGGAIYAVSKTSDRLIYTTSRVSKGYAFLPSNWPFLDSLLKALRKLKVVSPEVLEEHRRICEARSARSAAEHDLEHTIPELEKQYGIKLTKRQLAKIEKVRDQ